MAVLMLLMGVASPFWIRAIDEGVAGLANNRATAVRIVDTYNPNDPHLMEKR
jgi:hypothetical protein